jgi:hypothetical protein
MVRVNIEQFVYGLQALSESGDIFSAKEETFIYPGSMGILDKGAIASLNSAVHSVEPDGSRISKDELQKLMTDHYFSGEENFFFALDYFARKKGTENLFSSDAREFLKESLGAGIKDRACDFYLRLHSLGVHVTLEQCMQILEQIGEKYRSYVGNDVLQDKGFWEFFATIILRYHLPFGVIGDAEHVYANVIRNNFFDESRLTPLFMEGVIAAYSRHHQILSSPEFISFILVVQDSYAGVRVIKDVDYYVELYQSPDRRNAVLKHASYARKVTKHIPVTGSLEIDDLKVLKDGRTAWPYSRRVCTTASSSTKRVGTTS